MWLIAAASCLSQQTFLGGSVNVPTSDRNSLSQDIDPFAHPELDAGGRGELTEPRPDGTDSTTGQTATGTTFRLRGRIEIDAIATTQSRANESIFGDLRNDVGLRRARIGAEGSLRIGGRYITEIDLASGEVVLRDVFVELGDAQDAGGFRSGHYREPFSLELATGANSFAFLERSVINVLDPARNWGVGLFRAGPGETSTLALGIFHAGTDANDFQGGDGSTVGLTGRWTSAPIYERDGERLLHLGMAFSERLPEHGVVILNQQPQSPLLDLGDSATSPFLPQIRIPATFQQLLNLQCGTANGPFWTQAEWYGSWIDQQGGGPVFLHGCHADCGVFITGEHRQYQSSSGAFGPVRVNRPLLRFHSDPDRPTGWGAWELTARFAYLDFEDSDTPTGPGGQFVGIGLSESTFGVNWYLADHVRLMFNYSYAVPDEPNAGTSVANIFATRLAVFW
jgi:phosphate-selective porin OprO/OprP